MSLKTLVESGSGIQKKKFGSGSGINHSGSATLFKRVILKKEQKNALACIKNAHPEYNYNNSPPPGRNPVSAPGLQPANLT